MPGITGSDGVPGGEDSPPPRRAGGVVLTIGNFDGVHVGHRHLIAQTKIRASELGARSVVLTFDRHPAVVVRPDRVPRLLTAKEHKLELLEEVGVDDVVLLRFDGSRAAMPAEDFVEEVIVRGLGVGTVVVGASFRFGHDQHGDLALLESMGQKLGFGIEPVELLRDDSGVVSSSRVRALVAAGALEEAASLLERLHEVRGRAIEDGGSWRVAVGSDLCLPPPGRYAAEAGPLGDQRCPTVVDVPPPAGREGATELVLEVEACEGPEWEPEGVDGAPGVIGVGFVERL